MTNTMWTEKLEAEKASATDRITKMNTAYAYHNVMSTGVKSYYVFLQTNILFVTEQTQKYV